MSRPKVSIVAISFNQEAYVTKALDSFLMQKTNFDFEIIIADDASIDNTAKIIKNYQKKHPSKIHPILRTKNIGVQKNLNTALRSAQGDYIALCEADDYWTDATKLQRQFDFLESNKDYAICFHPVKVKYENDPSKDEIYPEEKDNFTLDKLVEHNFIQTNSVMYRAANYDNIPDDILPLDWYLHLLHAKNGKIGFIDQVMSVYRRHVGGIWWQGEDEEAEYKFLYNNFIPHQKFYKQASDLLNNKEYGRQMQYQAIVLTERVMQLDTDKQRALLSKVIKDAPDTLHFSLSGTAELISDLYKQNYEKSIALLHGKQKIEKLESNVQEILSSRSYKLAKIMVIPITFIKHLVARV